MLLQRQGGIERDTPTNGQGGQGRLQEVGPRMMAKQRKSVGGQSLVCVCVCKVCAKSLQSYLTLCDPMDCSLPGSSAHGILQARILEWVATSPSRGSS